VLPRLLSGLLCVSLLSALLAGFQPALALNLFASNLYLAALVDALCYLLAIPLDIPIQKVTTLTQNTFLPSHTVALTYWLTVGPFVRPMFILMIPFALSCATLRAVWVDMQNDGWRNRWRYRNDLPLLFRWPQWIVARDEAARGR